MLMSHMAPKSYFEVLETSNKSVSTLRLSGVDYHPLCFYAIVFCYAEFRNSLLRTYEAFIFASFGEEIVKMGCPAQMLFPVCLGP
jgi:hypothetical protein